MLVSSIALSAACSSAHEMPAADPSSDPREMQASRAGDRAGASAPASPGDAAAAPELEDAASEPAIGAPHTDAGSDPPPTVEDANDAGAAPPGETIVCEDQPVFSADPAVAQRFEGENGVFADACTAGGDLRKHACEMIQDPDCVPILPNPPPCPSVPTGVVLAQQIDCGGRCQDGTCVSRCPDFGDALEVVALQGDALVFANNRDARQLVCEPLDDSPDDAFDCAGVGVGMRGVISSLGLQGRYCTHGPFGNIGVCFEGDCTRIVQNCSYACALD